MHNSRLAAGAIAVAAFGMALPAHAQTPQQTPQTTQPTLAELEARLAKAEADAAEAKKEAEEAKAAIDQLPAPEPAAPAAASQNAFNPGIAAVLNGFGVLAKDDPGAAGISGFPTTDEITGPARGFSLGESEVSFAANIDPSLAGFLDFSISPDNEVELEEAYIRTTALPGGFTLKAGRFLSGIGYINERHAHDWSFSDAPLPYKAFLNTQLGDDGVQVRWLAPTDLYLEFGAEAFRGEAFPGAGSADNGAGTYTAFVKTGSDINTSSSWLGSLSYLHAKAEGRETIPGDLFDGKTDLGIASFVYKWAPNGNVTVNNLALTAEAFYGKDEGDFNGAPLSQTRTGWYAQGVYQFMPAWSAGLRLAGLSSDNPGPGFAGTSLDDLGHSPFATTALLEWDTSEFGRLRLQYTNDQSAAENNDVLTLQYTVIYGPHGAHRY
ncbi:MAG TPA: hypothetical protein VGO52_20490 [Hyphomonadaceae bacterium]|nr:hypothetical protein [Hyphomonadaceae bacterium]